MYVSERDIDNAIDQVFDLIDSEPNADQRRVLYKRVNNYLFTEARRRGGLTTPRGLPDVPTSRNQLPPTIVDLSGNPFIKPRAHERRPPGD
jgi:hypothetical protein